MKIQSGQDFANFLRRYAKEKSLTQDQFAKLVNRPRQTVGHWFTIGIKPKERREKIIEEFPEIFGVAMDFEEPAQPTSSDKSEEKEISKQILLLMKIELGRHEIVVLSDILQWFIDASADERNRFREELGSLWKNFLELTRAMTGERALELALQERRVKSGNDHD